LFVTRVLGFSGYYAGLAWGIALDAALDTSTVLSTTTKTYTGSTNSGALINYSATTGGTVYSVTSQDSLVTSLLADPYAGPILLADLAYLNSSTSTAAVGPLGPYYIKNGTTFTGLTITQAINYSATTTGGTRQTITSGDTTYYSGTSYSDVENKLVALLRSRGTVNESTQLTSFEVSGATNLILNPSFSGANVNPIGTFALSGISTVQGAFNYEVSLDKTQRNYLPKVLARGAQDGKTAVFVEELFDKMFSTYNTAGKIRGIKTSLINYSNSFSEYRKQYQEAITPYVVSELRGTKLLRLFRFHTISDGNAANEQFKISTEKELYTNSKKEKSKIEITVDSKEKSFLATRKVFFCDALGDQQTVPKN
jgi:hypothetical protein